MFSPPPGGATKYIAYRSVQYMDFAWVTITRDIFIPGPTQCGLSRSKHTPFYKFEEELALPSTGSWLPSRLSSTWCWKERTGCIFSTRNTPKKRDILSEKRESGMAVKKREFTPESGIVETYAVRQAYSIFFSRHPKAQKQAKQGLFSMKPVHLRNMSE